MHIQPTYLKNRTIPQTTDNDKNTERVYLEETFPEGGVLVGEEALGYIRVGHLQKVEVGLQLQADALLRQQRPTQRSNSTSCISTMFLICHRFPPIKTAAQQGSSQQGSSIGQVLFFRMQF